MLFSDINCRVYIESYVNKTLKILSKYQRPYEHPQPLVCMQYYIRVSHARTLSHTYTKSLTQYFRVSTKVLFGYEKISVSLYNYGPNLRTNIPLLPYAMLIYESHTTRKFRKVFAWQKLVVSLYVLCAWAYRHDVKRLSQYAKLLLCVYSRICHNKVTWRKNQCQYLIVICVCELAYWAFSHTSTNEFNWDIRVSRMKSVTHTDTQNYAISRHELSCLYRKLRK